MIVNVYVENEKKFDLKVRKNCKSIIKEIEKKIKEIYNCNVSRTMITGNIDFATGERNMEYILFGENLPFRKYKYEIGE